MIILKLLICLTAPITLGLAVLQLISEETNTSLLEKLALSFGLGLGLITLIMAGLNLMNLQLSFALLLTITMLLALPVLFWKKLKLTEREKIPNKRTLLKLPEVVILILIGLKILYVFFEATIKPVLSFDAFWRHSLIAKAIFLNGTFNTPFTTNLIADNPPFSSFSQAYIFIGLNTWNEMLGKIVFPLLFLSLLIVFYCNLRKYTYRLMSLIFTFLLSSLPFLVFHASTAYADFSQTYFYTVGTIYLFNLVYNRGKSSSDLIISALFLGLGVFVKRHGIYLAGIDALVLAAALYFIKDQDWQTKLNKILLFGVIIFILATPWILMNSSFFNALGTTISTPFSQATITAKENLPALSQRLIQGTPIILQKMFFFGNWQLAWLLFIICLIFFWQKSFKKPTLYLTILITSNFFYVFTALILTGAFRFLLDGTLLNRVMMYQIPLIIFFCGIIVSQEKSTQ